jgi:leader peptidase (prepilin peptidase)/N-methyltransferase
VPLIEAPVQAALLLLAAPVIGSFLGVVVLRMPEGRAIVRSRSSCRSCGAMLRMRDLVPVASWIAAGGRCRHCGRWLGWFYPGIETAALAVGLVALAVDGMPRAWLDCLLGWWLLALGWTDCRFWLLPDRLTLPLVAAGLAAAALFAPTALPDRVIGALCGYLLLRLIAAVYRGWRGREGLGGGDAKLLGGAGAWVGASALPQVIFGAALSALAVAAALRLAGIRLQAHSALPFGPFIALALWAVWLAAPLAARGG